MNKDIYLEVEQHPSGWWFNVVHPHGTPENEAIVLAMNGPFGSERAAGACGEFELNRQIQSAA